MSDKGKTVPTRVLEVQQNQFTNFPICLVNTMVVLKIEVSTDLSMQRKRRRRDITVSQTINQKEFFQVLSDNGGMEITVRINKNKATTPIISTTTTPVPSSRWTTTRTMPTTTTLPEWTHPLSYECEEYKMVLFQTGKCVENEIRKIDAGESSRDFCKISLSGKYVK